MSDRTEKLDLNLVLRLVEEIERGAHAALEATERLVIPFGAIEGRMSALESRMTGLESYMTRLEGRTGGIVQSYNRIEQILAWFGRCRRLAKDFENLNRTAMAFLHLASIRLMLRRLCKTA